MTFSKHRMRKVYFFLLLVAREVDNFHLSMRRADVTMLAPHRYHRYRWESVNDLIADAVICRFFKAGVGAKQNCEIFTIEGVPAAAMLYTNVSQGSPVVDEFVINKGMLLVFDAGPIMRRQLYNRHRRLTTRHAKRRNDFLLF